MIIDATGAKLGRLATFVAKKLLDGEKIIIINAEKAIITGNPDNIVEKYLQRRQRGSPQHGPFFPKRPDLIVRRAIRGMLPYKKPKGRKTFRNLKVMIGEPKRVEEKIIKFAEKQKPIKTRSITIYELAKRIGWNG